MNEEIKTQKDSVGGRLITNFIFLVLYLIFWAAIPFFVFKKGNDAGIYIAIVGNAILILLTWCVPYFRRSSWLRWWAWLGLLDIAWWIYCLVS